MTNKVILDITRTASPIAGPEGQGDKVTFTGAKAPQSCGDRAQAEDCHGNRSTEPSWPKSVKWSFKRTSAPVSSREYTLDIERHNLCLLACRAKCLMSQRIILKCHHLMEFVLQFGFGICTSFFLYFSFPLVFPVGIRMFILCLCYHNIFLAHKLSDFTDSQLQSNFSGWIISESYQYLF